MLSDLDELVLTCADPRSKAYLREAVQCYKSGAYRASVVACWIAVAFDLVDKIKELAASGDKQAQAEVARFERIQEIGDVKNALGFEKNLPVMAREKFEFISHLQYQDLKRLVEDRNRCAHFPKKQKEVDAFLSNGPLKKPKTTLFTSFLKILVKTTFLPGETLQRVSRSRTSLVALKNIHPELWTSYFPKIISDLIRDTTDNDSLVSCAIALITPKSLNSWDCLGVVEKMKIKQFVEDFPKNQLNHIDYFSTYQVIMSCIKPRPQESKMQSLRSSQLQTGTYSFLMR